MLTVLQVEFKAFPEVIEYYYTWKKYCNDEYRGRNRHISEEVSHVSSNDETFIITSPLHHTLPQPLLHHYYIIYPKYIIITSQILTDEDDTGYPQLHSSSSSGSAEMDPTPPPQTSDGDKSYKYKIKKPDRNPQQPLQFHQHPISQSLIPEVPLAYAPHTSNSGVGTPVQQYKCKYPGCNQVSSP